MVDLILLVYALGVLGHIPWLWVLSVTAADVTPVRRAPLVLAVSIGWPLFFVYYAGRGVIEGYRR